jgi:hypothetical protein
MNNLGLACFDLDIRQHPHGFQYMVSFYLRETKMWHSDTGSAASPSQCFDAAMKYLTESIRIAEEVTAEEYRLL